MDNSAFAALGILLVVAFVAVGARWPRVAVAITFGLAPMQQDVSSGLGIRFSVGELCLCLLCLLALTKPDLQCRRWTLGPLLAPVLLYLMICVLASLHDGRGSTGWISIVQMMIYLIVAIGTFACFGRASRDLELASMGLLLMCAFLGLSVVVNMSSYVYGLHKNGVGGSLACGVIVGAERWLTARDRAERRILLFLLLATTGGLVVTLSRGAWISTVVGLIFITAIRGDYRMLARWCVALVPIVAISWFLLPNESKEFATGFESERSNIQARWDSIDFARERFESEPLLGVGVGLRKEFDATNIVWTTLAETGILGLMAFLSIHVVVFRLIWVVRGRLDMSSQMYSLVVIGGAVLFAKLAHGLVDHYWSRGSLMLAWAGAGLVVRAYLFVREVDLRVPKLARTSLNGGQGTPPVDAIGADRQGEIAS